MTKNNKPLAFLIKDRLFVHGQEIKGKINSQDVEGRLHITKSGICYFLQNKMQGSTPSNFFGNPEINLGYTGAWSFSINDVLSDVTLDLSTGIVISREQAEIVNIPPSVTITSKSSSCVMNVKGGTETTIAAKHPDYTIINAEVKGKTAASKSMTLFTQQSHPDCCGATLLFGFNGARRDQIGYATYDKLQESNLQEIRDAVGLGRGSAKIAHLAAYQEQAIDFVERIGFKKIHSYSNKNSGNIVNIYQYD